jgi:phosphoserine phosphatase
MESNNTGQKDRSLVVCDVCDTLVQSNTTFDYIRFVVHRESKVRQAVFYSVNSKYSPVYYLFAILYRIFGLDFARKTSMLLLRGLSVEKSSQYANEFFFSFLKNKFVNEVIQLVNQFRLVHRVVLVSSSIEPVVRVLAEQLQVEYVCTSLKTVNNRLTGFVKRDITGIKHQVIVKEKFYHGGNLIVLTDNTTDVDLVCMAQTKFVVISHESQKRFWLEFNPTFILSS